MAISYLPCFLIPIFHMMIVGLNLSIHVIAKKRHKLENAGVHPLHQVSVLGIIFSYCRLNKGIRV